MSRDYDDHIARTKGASPVALIDEREAFEDAWRAQYPDHGLTVFLRSLQDNARYTNTRTQDGWLMWQARAILSRASSSRAEVERDGCTRSHPHENMSAECEAKTIAARKENAEARAKVEIPEDYVLVPKVPTKEMCAKAADAYLCAHGYGDAWIRAVYTAMLSAAEAPNGDQQ